MEENLEKKDTLNSEISDNTIKSTSAEIKENNTENVIIANENIADKQNNPDSKVDMKIGSTTPSKTISKQTKEIPIEKKPFQEFINVHLIPALTKEIK